MTQYAGAITVIIEAENECTAEAALRAIAQSIEDESDAVIFADHNGDVENYEDLEAECQQSLESGPPSPTRFDAYEIEPCRRYIDIDEPQVAFVERCEPFPGGFLDAVRPHPRRRRDGHRRLRHLQARRGSVRPNYWPPLYRAERNRRKG